MIETTIGNLLTIKPILQALSNQPMPVKDSFKVMRILMALEKEYELIEKTRIECIEKYAEKDGNGQIKVDEKGQAILQSEKIDEFDKEFNTFLTTSIAVLCDKININLLENFSLTPNELMNISAFIEE